MKTSNFKKYKGNKGVAICLYPPLDWKGEVFKELAPTKSTFFQKKANQINEAEYEKRFREETLSKLDPQKIYDRFKDRVLLCWEPTGDFCHRRIISSWIKESLNIDVLEWEIENEDNSKQNKQPNTLF